MPGPAADSRQSNTPKVLASLAGLVGFAGVAGFACVACCLPPALIAAGAVGTGAAGAVIGWLPAIALALAVLVGATWWLTRRRAARGCATCGQGTCGCQMAEEPLQIIDHDEVGGQECFGLAA